MDRLAVVYPSDIPAELKKFNQWVLWQAEPCGDRVSKVPYRLDGRRASSMNPNDWTGFETAWGAYISPGLGRRFSGIGFVFRAGGGIVGIDFDHVVTDGVVEPWVTRTIEAFNSYTELSVSGTGLHILCGGSLPDGKGRKREPVEMYCQGRYFTMSGNVFGEPEPLRDAQPEINRLLEWMKPDGQKPPKIPPRVSACPDDRKLLHRAASAKNGYKFSHLWRGDTSNYGGDDSRADLALLSMLLFWTRGDESRSDALFRQSGLSRDKWTKRPDYRERCFRVIRDGR